MRRCIEYRQLTLTLNVCKRYNPNPDTNPNHKPQFFHFCTNNAPFAIGNK